MQSLSLGGIVLPVAPLLLLLSVTLAAWMARNAQVANWVWNALWIGVITARLGYVLWHNEAFFNVHHTIVPIRWMDIIDIRDGGWLTPLGWIGAGIYMAWHGWRNPTLRRAITYAALTGFGVWLVGQGILRGMEGDKVVAPAITLQAFQTQQTQTLPQIVAGKPTVVNIWATWCPPCRAEMPTLVQAQQNQSDVQIILVNQGESDAVIAAYLQRSGLDKQNIRNIWRDSNAALAPALGAAGLPTTVFFNAQGERVDAHTGVLSAAVLQVQMQRLRRGNAVKTP